MNGDTKGMGEPPKGVITGESVPRENEEEQFTQSKVDEVKGRLKAYGEPFIEMQDAELEEKAREYLRSPATVVN